MEKRWYDAIDWTRISICPVCKEIIFESQDNIYTEDPKERQLEILVSNILKKVKIQLALIQESEEDNNESARS